MSGANKDNNHAVMSDPDLRRDAESFLKGVLLGGSARVLKHSESPDTGVAAKPENADLHDDADSASSGKRGQPASVSEKLSLDGLSELASRIEKATGKRIRSYREIQEDYQRTLKDDIARMENERYRKKLESLMQNCEISDYWEFSNMDDDNNPAYRKLIEFCLNWVQDFRTAETE